jgi:protein phosphatase
MARQQRHPQSRVVASGMTDVGLQREHNEDSYLLLPEHSLFIVADGMGGHRAGDVASRLATDTIAEFFRSTASEDVTWPYHFDTSLSEEENRLLTGIRIANRQVFERSVRSREYQGMGTTMVSMLFSEDLGRVFIGHVGDSRCYRVRGGEIRLMTRDHSLVNDYLLAMPELTEDQKNELPKNVITRALGMQDHVVVDLQTDSPEAGDWYLLCSDGLSGMISDDDILRIVDSSEEPGELCRRLIAKANENGGEDNITAVLLRVERGEATSPEAEDEDLGEAVTDPGVQPSPAATAVERVEVRPAHEPPAAPPEQEAKPRSEPPANDGAEPERRDGEGS